MFKLNQFLYNWVSRHIDARPLGITRIGIGIAFLMDWFNKIDRRESTFDPTIFHYGRKRSGSQALYRLFSLLPLTSFFAVILRPRFSQSLLQKIAHIN